MDDGKAPPFRGNVAFLLQLGQPPTKAGIIRSGQAAPSNNPITSASSFVSGDGNGFTVNIVSSPFVMAFMFHYIEMGLLFRIPNE